MPKSAFKTILRLYGTDDVGSCFVNAESQSVGNKVRQAKKPLLCEECEDKFSKHGETHVIGSCYKKADQFALMTQLDIASPSGCSNNGKRYYLGLDVTPKINFQAYAYFALSILWRGSVTDWGSPYNGFKNALGDVYTESFRQYLYGNGAFPENTLVCVYVDFDQPSQMGLLILPVPAIKVDEGSNSRYRVHTFAIPGISFKVVVGGNAKQFSSINLQGNNICFFEWSFTDSGNFYDGVVLAAQKAEPKGKLALSLLNDSKNVSSCE